MTLRVGRSSRLLAALVAVLLTALAMLSTSPPAAEAATAASFVGKTSAANSSRSLSVPAPQGVAAGDVQLAVVAVSTGSETVSTPSGWTLVKSSTVTSGDTFRAYVFSSTTATGATTFTKSGNRQWQVARLAYRGSAGIGPSAITISPTGSSHALPKVSTSGTQDRVVGAVVTDGVQLSSAPGSGWTERHDRSTGVGADPKEFESIGVVDRVVASPSAVTGSVSTSARQRSIAVSAVLRSSGAAKPGVLPYWGEPSLAQEFEGSTLDPAVWQVRSGFGLGNDSGYLLSENVEVANGHLRLISKKLPTPITTAGRTRYVSTASLWTQNKWSQRGGRFEARMRMDWPEGAAPKIWPGWWSRAVGASGEVDFFESIAGPHLQGARHPHGAPSYTLHESTNHEAGTVKIEKKELAVDAFDGRWHTFAMEWFPPGTDSNPRMDFYRDGVKVYTARYADHPWLDRSHPGDIYLRMDLQAGGSWHGYVDAKDAAAYGDGKVMEIDYVRAWELP